MKMIVTIFIAIYCAAISNGIPTTDAENSAYAKGIAAAADQAQKLALAETHEGDSQRSDLGNTIHNTGSYVVRFVELLKSFAGEPTPVLEYVLRGLNSELKKSNGNLLNDVTGALKGATSGLIDGIHRIQTHDTGQNLSRGKNPSSDPRAAKIIALTNYALKLATEKQANSNEGRSNTDATLHNLGILFKMLPPYVFDIGTQPTIQVVSSATNGAVDGLSNGLKCGLGKGITSALKGASEGLDTGLQNFGPHVLKGDTTIG